MDSGTYCVKYEQLLLPKEKRSRIVLKLLKLAESDRIEISIF